MPHRIVPFFGAKIEIVDSERLLKNGRVRATRNGHLHSIRMTHVMAPHDAGAVCEPLRCLSLAERNKRTAEFMAPHETTTMLPRYSSRPPSLLTTILVIRGRPHRFRAVRHAYL